MSRQEHGGQSSGWQPPRGGSSSSIDSNVGGMAGPGSRMSSMGGASTASTSMTSPYDPPMPSEQYVQQQQGGPQFGNYQPMMPPPGQPSAGAASKWPGTLSPSSGGPGAGAYATTPGQSAPRPGGYFPGAPDYGQNGQASRSQAPPQAGPQPDGSFNNFPGGYGQGPPRPPQPLPPHQQQQQFAPPPQGAGPGYAPPQDGQWGRGPSVLAPYGGPGQAPPQQLAPSYAQQRAEPTEQQRAEGYAQHLAQKQRQMRMLAQQQQHLQHQQQLQMQQQQQQMAQKGDDDDGDDGGEDGDEEDGARKGRGAAQKGTSDFVKKLFKMLSDTSYSSIVSWSASGESFVVKTMNDFTKHVLPRHFRHSNFASFVRQLNKYDFHKVKNPEEQAQGADQAWEFKHPEFLRGREDLLENVKRKMPTGKKVTKDRSDSPTMPSAADAADKGAAGYGELKNQVAALTASQDQMSSHINNLTKQYQGVIGEMLTFQRNMVQQDQLMQQLIQYLMQESRKPAIGDGNTPGGSSMQGLLDTGASDSPFVAPETAQSLIGNYSTLARDSFATMSQVSERMAAAQSGRDQMQGRAGSSSAGPSMNGAPNHRDSDGGPPSPKSSGSPASDYAPNGKGKASTAGDRMYFHPPHLNAEDASAGDVFSSALQAPGSQALEHAGLRVYTVGTLQPRSDFGTLPSDGSGSPGDAVASALNGRAPSVGAGTESRPFGINVPSLEELPADMPRVDRRFSTAAVTPLPGAGPQTQANVSDGLATPSDGGQNMLRIRRSTYVPGWAVPPRVLVVDDNDVCRKMSSKFLQVFGCAIDVAVDGVNAVNKMNLEKYDLVLMDIVMPNLDGVSATSLIREFDPRTPIISMTSNSGPKELLNYMSSGMNDILPKPFTKEGLLNMLEKHLIHLKTVQKMDEIPKSFGLPPLSDDALQSVLSATAASAAHLQNGAPSPRGLGSMLGNSAAGASPFAAMMGNGPARFTNADSPEEKNSDDDEGVDNPLAGMGFSDDEYISMLQNLIAAGSVSDSQRGEMSDSVASALGVARGEGAGGGTRSKESTPVNLGVRKRSAEPSDASDAHKRSRVAGLQG